MIGGCITGAAYPFKADIYKKKRVVNQDTGQITYTWEEDFTTDLAVESFTSTSFKAQGTSEIFGDEYEKYNYLRIYTPMNLGRSAQLTNIRPKSGGSPLYTEIELKGAPATWYNVNGSNAVIDPWGNVVQWDSLIQRAQEQGGK